MIAILAGLGMALYIVIVIGVSMAIFSFVHLCIGGIGMMILIVPIIKCIIEPMLNSFDNSIKRFTS